MSHKYVLLKEVCEKASSNIAQKDLAECDGIYPIYGASGYIKSVDFFQQAKDYIAIVKDGAGIGRAMKLPAKSSVIGTMQYVLPNDNINISYLYYAICSMHLEKYFSGATIPHIYFRDYQNEQLPLPTLEEQAKIANVFGRIDYFIKKEKEQLINLDKLVKSRFIEMFGEISVNSKHWKESRLEDLIIGKASNGFFAKPDKYSNDSKIGVICVGDVVNRKYSNINNLRRINMDEVSFKKYKVTYGDMLFCRSSLVKEGIAKASIVPKNSENAVFECHVIRIKLNTSIIVPEYMQAFSTTDYFRNQMIRMSKTATMTTIGQKDIISSSVLVPPIDIQNQFVDFMAQVDKSKLAIQQSLDELETLKKSLMQQYFG